MFLSNRQRKDARRGFTLTELLVSLTISVGVLGAIFIIFNAGNRSLRQGYMTIRGFDLARGTFNILESDVDTAFTQRELGDDNKFFGTPIGFTYVGTANPGTGAGAANIPQIARVTYVVYYGDPLNPASGQRGSDRVIIEQTYDEQDEALGDPNRFFQGQSVITYSMLRFVEPGVGDLDSYPSINGLPMWDALASGESAESQLIAAYLAEPIIDAPALDYAFGGRDNLGRRVGTPTPEQQHLQDARKRELWIRMLSGDPRLPNIWEILGREPRDFVVAENIYLPENIAPLIPELNDSFYAFFRYGVSRRSPMLLQFNTATGAIELDADTGQPLMYEGPTGNPDIVPTVVRDGERLATTGEVRLRDGQPDERWHLYWNSAYNLFYDISAGEDPRNLGVIAASIPGSLDALNVFGEVDLARTLGVTLDQLATDVRLVQDGIIPINIPNPYQANSVPGTPYDAQLPEQVHVRFEYLLESPWSNVAEFKREFDQIMDVPSGYTRKPPPTVAGL